MSEHDSTDPDGDDYEDLVAADIAKVKRCLSIPSEELRALNPTDATFVTCVVISLNADFWVSIEGIPWDQWGAIDSRYRRGADPEDKRIECDSVEEGMAATWLYWAEKLNDPRFVADQQ